MYIYVYIYILYIHTYATIWIWRDEDPFTGYFEVGLLVLTHGQSWPYVFFARETASGTDAEVTRV